MSEKHFIDMDVWYYRYVLPPQHLIFFFSHNSGSITSNEWYTRALLVAVSVSAVVAVKRLWLGLYLGKKTFANYAEDLAKVVKKLVVLSDVASLARQFLIESLESSRNLYSKRKAPSVFKMSQEEVRSTRSTGC